jgi:hypothetical protein
MTVQLNINCRFSFGDGLIEEICPHSEESTWALNVKRGFLSAFQNTMRRLDLEHKGEEVTFSFLSLKRVT